MGHHGVQGARRQRQVAGEAGFAADQQGEGRAGRQAVGEMELRAEGGQVPDQQVLQQAAL